jgi:hypothetical protein
MILKLFEYIVNGCVFVALVCNIILLCGEAI